MSPNVPVRTDRYREALEFYVHGFGFKNNSENPELGDYDATLLRLFVIEDLELKGLVHELFVEDLEAARGELVNAGYEVIRWRG